MGQSRYGTDEIDMGEQAYTVEPPTRPTSVRVLPTHPDAAVRKVSVRPAPEAPDVTPERPRSSRPSGMRPHRKYRTPGEMWSWHATRMGIFVGWVTVATTTIIAATTAVVIFVELV